MEAIRTDRDSEAMAHVISGLPTTAAKVRALAKQGYACAEIARFLDIRYQQAYNVLKRAKTTDAPGALWTKIDAGGRVIVPAVYRRALDLAEGSDVQIRLEDDEIKIVPRDVAIRRAQEIVRRYVPGGESLVDDLLRERRREVAQEEAEIAAWQAKHKATE